MRIAISPRLAASTFWNGFCVTISPRYWNSSISSSLIRYCYKYTLLRQNAYCCFSVEFCHNSDKSIFSHVERIDIYCFPFACNQYLRRKKSADCRLFSYIFPFFIKVSLSLLAFSRSVFYFSPSPSLQFFKTILQYLWCMCRNSCFLWKEPKCGKIFCRYGTFAADIIVI